jgi:hypothetical protein
MNHQASTETATESKPAQFRASALLAGAFALAGVLLLGGCSSGSGGDDVTIGSGQNQDPVTLDFPVFYVKRPVPDPDDPDLEENDARELVRFEIGADLFMRDRASPSAPEINITAAETTGLGDIRDVDINFDGSKVVFAMRAKFIEGADEEDQPTWNIWEYDAKAKVLRRLMASDTTAEEGHDIMPHYLPDGRVVFSSTRQQQAKAIQLDENKPQYAGQDEDDNEPAFVLHVMDADGGNIHQISFNQSHDLDPSVMNDGRIVYTRWEHAIDDNQMDLYSVNPDGTGLQLLYGATSHNTGTIDPTTGLPTVIQFLNPRTMPDGRTLAIVRPFGGTYEGGDLVMIDTANYVDNTQPTATNVGMTGPAQVRALPTDVRTVPGPSPGGRYRSAAPLFDGTNRLLVSWSQCRLLEDTRIVPCTSERLANPDAVEAPPLYGVYVYDVNDNTQKPIVVPQEGFIFTEVVAGSSRTLPPVILDKAAGVDFPAELATENVGILDIRSVYDFDGTDTAPGGIAAVRNPANANYATRPARFLRIEKVVSLPDEDTRDVPNTAFGPNGRRFGMRDILGYAPIEPDGSVRVKVPADVAFAISILDANGRRTSGRHTNWLQVKSGETLQCIGCHNGAATTPRSHGRAGLFNSANAGATATGSLFPNTNPLLAPFDAGETMAQTRSRSMCGASGACAPSVNIVYDDYWPTAPGASFDMCYVSGASGVPSNPADLTARHVCSTSLTTTLPTTSQCSAAWGSLCRVTIHYERHIHPLWGVDRRVFDAGAVLIADHTCNTCHSQTNPVDATVQVPQGQLDLSDGASDDEPDHFKSYRELLFTDNEQTLDNGAVVDRLVQVGVDPVTGLPQFATVPVGASMSGGGARASAQFFNKFDNGGGTVDHRGFLTPAELKLIAEWLDIGAQYYNDPFVAPEN